MTPKVFTFTPFPIRNGIIPVQEMQTVLVETGKLSYWLDRHTQP